MIPTPVVLLQIVTRLVLIGRLFEARRRSLLAWMSFTPGASSTLPRRRFAGLWLVVPWYTALVYLFGVAVACWRAGDVRTLLASCRRHALCSLTLTETAVMNRKTLSAIGFQMWLAVALVTASLGTAAVLGQTPAVDGHHEVAAEQGKPQASSMMNGQKGMMADQTAMMAEQKAMMARMAAADQKLSDLVATMNTAKGDEKVAAIAAVVNELATQRTQMQRQMMRMQSRMMDHMMSHMSAMHEAGAMTNKQAPETAPPTEPDHSAHHPEK